jgi:hypothetical protein
MENLNELSKIVREIRFIKDVVAVYRLHRKNQILQVDLEKRFKNIEGIKEGVRFAMSLGLDKHEVEVWQRRITKISLKNILSLILEKGNRKNLKSFIFHIYDEDSKYLSIFFEYKIFIKLIFFLIHPYFLKTMRNLYKKIAKKRSEDN